MRGRRTTRAPMMMIDVRCAQALRCAISTTRAAKQAFMHASSHGLPRLRGRTPHAGNSGVSCAPQQATGRRRARRRRACRSGSRSANRYHSSHSIWCYGIGAIRCEECAARLTQPVCIEEPSGVTVVVGLPPACVLAQFGAFGARRVALLVRLTRLDATAARRSPNPRRKARVVRLPLARLWRGR